MKSFAPKSDLICESALMGVEPCRRCGGALQLTAGEALVEGRAHWDIEALCGSCGPRWRECGIDAAPARVRAALLAENGATVLRIAAAPVDGVALAGVLRNTLATPLTKIREVTDELRAAGRTGTMVEMELLAAAFRSAGIRVEVRHKQRSPM